VVRPEPSSYRPSEAIEVSKSAPWMEALGAATWVRTSARQASCGGQGHRRDCWCCPSSIFSMGLDLEVCGEVKGRESAVVSYFLEMYLLSLAVEKMGLSVIMGHNRSH